MLSVVNFCHQYFDAWLGSFANLEVQLCKEIFIKAIQLQIHAFL